MDKAHCHSTNQNGNGIFQRTDQIRQTRPCGCGIKDLCNLQRCIPEEAARDCAPSNGGNTTHEEQFTEVLQHTVGLLELQHHCCCQNHQQAIAHIRHHHTVEEDEEGGHIGVGINPVISGKAVHFGNCVEASGEDAVLQLYRNRGIFILCGILGRPCTVELIQNHRQGLFVFSRYPALQHGNAFAAHQLCRSFRSRNLGCHGIAAQLQFTAELRQCHNFFPTAFFFRCHVCQRLLSSHNVFDCGALVFSEVHSRKAQRTQCLLRSFQIRTVANHSHILQRLFAADHKQLCLLGSLCQSGNRCSIVHGAGEGPQNQRTGFG